MHLSLVGLVLRGHPRLSVKTFRFERDDTHYFRRRRLTIVFYSPFRLVFAPPTGSPGRQPASARGKIGSEKRREEVPQARRGWENIHREKNEGEGDEGGAMPRGRGAPIDSDKNCLGVTKPPAARRILHRSGGRSASFGLP